MGASGRTGLAGGSGSGSGPRPPVRSALQAALASPRHIDLLVILQQQRLPPMYVSKRTGHATSAPHHQRRRPLTARCPSIPGDAVAAEHVPSASCLPAPVTSSLLRGSSRAYSRWEHDKTAVPLAQAQAPSLEMNIDSFALHTVHREPARVQASPALAALALRQPLTPAPSPQLPPPSLPPPRRLAARWRRPPARPAPPKRAQPSGPPPATRKSGCDVQEVMSKNLVSECSRSHLPRARRASGGSGGSWRRR